MRRSRAVRPHLARLLFEERPETQAWRPTFMALVDGEPAWGNFDEVTNTS